MYRLQVTLAAVPALALLAAFVVMALGVADVADAVTSALVALP